LGIFFSPFEVSFINKKHNETATHPSIVLVGLFRGGENFTFVF